MTARAFSDIFGEADAAAPVAVGVTYATQQIVQLTIPAAGGPFVDVNGDTANNSTEPLAMVPVGWVQATDPITPAEFALVNMSEAVSVSRDVPEGVIADVPRTAADYAVPKLQSFETLENWRLMKKQYEAVPADGQAHVGHFYNITAADATVALPVLREDGSALQMGDTVTMRNLTPVIDAHVPFITGSYKLASTGSVVPAIPLTPDSSVTATWNGSEWESPIYVPLVVTLTSAHSGRELVQGITYLIQGDSPGMEFFLPEFPGSKIKLRLTTNSAFPVTIKQNAGVATQHIRDEQGNVYGDFVLPMQYAGQLTEIWGDPDFAPAGRWNAYRQWELDNINNNAVPWTPSIAYTAGDVVQANRPADGVLYLYSRDADGTSGAGTFDVTEEADWTAIGEATIGVPILETVTFTVRGYVSSWTQVTNVVFKDKAGAAYDMNDWTVVADDLGDATVGQTVFGSSFSPPINGPRTIKVQYAGPSQRFGLSDIDMQLRGDAATTALISASASMFDGDSESYSRAGAQQGAVTYTVNGVDGWTFLTHAKIAEVSEVNYTDLQLNVLNTAGKYFAVAPTGTNNEIDGQTYLINLPSDITPPALMTAAWWGNPANMIVVGQYTASATDTVVYPGAADNMQLGPLNIRYQDDPDLTALQQPTGVLGKDYAVGVVAANRGDITGEPKVKITHYTSVDRGNGVELLETDSPKSDLPIRRYTADGAISDEDQRAIFETGANNMTLPVSVQDRLIQIISEGPATIITADGTEQFTGSAGTSTDSILNVNETFKWATILGRGAAAGWSQYVGLVATAQSVGAMVDFSESPGPGDAGSFSLALTNSGANLRYILTLTCSNGTNFSPPLDVDDGTNRWWYDFDHTTGVVNIRRFGAFAGGSVRGVALYS